MEKRIHYDHCPVCGSSDLKKALTAKDYTVSQETFDIWECNSCTLRFTQDIPDDQSIAKYYQSEDYISHSNTSRGLINNVYQSVRKKTMETKRRLVQKGTGLEKGKLLDVGSGTGTFVQHMILNGWDVTGLEPDAGARKVAADSYGVELSAMDQFHQLQPGTFDAITLWHVLEHVHELNPYLQRLKVLLKQNGRIFIAVPNYTSKDAVVYEQHWAAYDVPRHLYHFSPQSMKKLVSNNGLKMEAIHPMWFDSFYISMLSSKYKNADRSNRPAAQSSSNLPDSFWTGLRSNMQAWGNAEKCSSVVYVISK